jgi:hypothetical protein
MHWLYRDFFALDKFNNQSINIIWSPTPQNFLFRLEPVKKKEFFKEAYSV